MLKIQSYSSVLPQVMEPQAFTLIGYYWFCLSVSLFFLYNFRGYLKRKPTGFQTLLDGANIHLLEYLGLAVSIHDVIAVSLEIFNHQVNQIWAEIIAWILLLGQQLFYYQLLLCGIIRLMVVLGWNPGISDEKLHKWIRRSLIVLTFASTLTLVILDHKHPLPIILQGGKNSTIRLKLNLVPTLVALAFFTQIISRSIVFVKLHKSSMSHESGNELISAGFYTLVFVIIFFSYIIVKVFDLGLRFAFIFGHFSYLTLCLQIFSQSQSIRKCMFHKYPTLNKRKNFLFYKVEPLFDVKV